MRPAKLMIESKQIVGCETELFEEKDNRSQIENFAISLLEKKGYQYFYGPEIAPDAENSGAGFVRESFEEVVLVSVLKKAIERIGNLGTVY